MKKKILFAIESLAGGGAEKILATIVKHIDDSKFEVTVLAVVKTGIYVREIERYCKLISILPDYKTLKNPIDQIKYKVEYKRIYNGKTSDVYKKYIKEKYDVEIAFIEGYVTKLIGSSINNYSKKYAWLHIDMIRNPHADRNYLNKEEQMNTYGKYNKIFAVSDSVKQSFQKKFGEDYPIEVHYNPVGSVDIIKKSNEKMDIIMDDKKWNFVTLGRLTKQKGYERLLRIAKRLKSEKFDFGIYILGDGELREEYQTYIIENNLEDVVVLLGILENPYPYLKKADVFVCSSRTEGFSTAATEALILQKPIITTDCAGMKELFGQYECGIITENSEMALEEGLRQIINNPSLLEIFKENEKIRANEFSIENAMIRFERILDE